LLPILQSSKGYTYCFGKGRLRKSRGLADKFHLSSINMELTGRLTPAACNLVQLRQNGSRPAVHQYDHGSSRSDEPAPMAGIAKMTIRLKPPMILTDTHLLEIRFAYLG
jgi:hypothetical protein